MMWRIFLLILAGFSLSFGEENAGQSDQLNQDIKNLEKRKEYFEATIKRTKRTAWRLEFQDPGYSRQLDQQAKMYQQELDTVNAELAEKYQERDAQPGQ
ncbi:MAG: hypothetical protein K940chlam8_00482 [Chlamydiae bacterium]|nr:hypothetical protein [Chlamydiota bacterium]